MVFVDTSAFLAVLDSSELLHRAADGVWQRMLAGEDELVTTNYVLLELAAVVQSRLGLPAIRAFQNDVLPALRVEWIGREDHEAGMNAVLAAGRRGLSLVDCASFHVIRRLGLTNCFTLDKHFKEQGFKCLP